MSEHGGDGRPSLVLADPLLDALRREHGKILGARDAGRLHDLDDRGDHVDRNDQGNRRTT